MNDQLLMIKGLVTMLPEQSQVDIKNCKIAIEEVLNRYPEEIGLLAVGIIGLEKQE